MLCSSAIEGKIPDWILLINRSDTVNSDALNLLFLFGDSKQLGSKVFLSDVEAADLTALARQPVQGGKASRGEAGRARRGSAL